MVRWWRWCSLRCIAANLCALLTMCRPKHSSKIIYSKRVHTHPGLVSGRGKQLGAAGHYGTTQLVTRRTLRSPPTTTQNFSRWPHCSALRILRDHLSRSSPHPPPAFSEINRRGIHNEREHLNICWEYIHIPIYIHTTQLMDANKTSALRPRGCNSSWIVLTAFKYYFHLFFTAYHTTLRRHT